LNEEIEENLINNNQKEGEVHLQKPSQPRTETYIYGFLVSSSRKQNSFLVIFTYQNSNEGDLQCLILSQYLQNKEL
jgi:hypothetical protein